MKLFYLAWLWDFAMLHEAKQVLQKTLAYIFAGTLTLKILFIQLFIFYNMQIFNHTHI